MKKLRLVTLALLLSSLFAFTACEEEEIMLKGEGDSEPELPDGDA
ncbi:MAG: hypothetical protein OEX02_02815 [Cyclobacteriaceae bacterium]|nr:hypothetical protein [Cyclobacteriaceae bacterium]